MNLYGHKLYRRLEKDGMIQSAKKIKRQEDKIRIHTLQLSCGYCDDITDDAIEVAASVDGLRMLRIV